MKKLIRWAIAAIIPAMIFAIYTNSFQNAGAYMSSAVGKIDSAIGNWGTSSSEPVQDQNVEGSLTVQSYFPRAGQAPAPVLTQIINDAKSTLDVAIYSFTDQDIANAYIDAKKRGVQVRVITDRESSSGQYQEPVLDSLKEAGIPVKINTHKDLMHMKVTISDNQIVTTGSFNYTITAEKYNDEVFVVINSKTTAQTFEKEFAEMWNDTQNFESF